MLTLTSTLLAHQKQASGRRPSLRVTASATRAYVPLFRWQRYYTGAENDSPHGIALADDASLIRCRNDAGTLYVSRVVAPGSGSTYSSWTNLASIAAGGGVDVDARAGTQELTLVAADGTALKTWQSNDKGATWTGPTTRVTEASAIGSVAIAYRASGDGDLCVFYTIGTSTTLQRLRRTSGVWDGAGTTWTKSGSVASLTGVSAGHDGAEFILCITGTEITTLHKRAWAALMGDLGLPSNVWSALVNVGESDKDSTTTFAGPAIVAQAGSGRAWFAQLEAGNVAFNRALYSYVPYNGLATGSWSEPAPHEASSANGLAVALSPDETAAWASTPSGVWYASLPSSLDLSARVLSCRYRLQHDASRWIIELDNHDGGLNPSSLPPLTASLVVGGELIVEPGYLSGAAGAAEYGVALRFNVDAIKHRLLDSGNSIIVECSGPWELAGRLRATQAWQVASGSLTRLQTFTKLAARAGIAVSSSGASGENPTGDWSTYSPGFAIAQGESFAAALRRLWEVEPDGIRTENNQLLIVGMTAGDSSDYTYGPADHPVLSIETLDIAPQANWTRLAGPDRYADDRTLASVYQHGPRLQTVRNLDATTNAKATAWAAALLRRRTWEDQAGELVAPVNAGQQLYDAVTVNSAPLGLTSQKYRVIGLTLDYRRGPRGAHYDHTLTLGEL